MKNIAVVTSSRADYGLLRNLVKLIKFSKKKKITFSCHRYTFIEEARLHC